MDRDSSPAIALLAEDRRLTGSFGCNLSAIGFRDVQAQLAAAGGFRLALLMGLNDIQDKFPGKYEEALKQAFAYCDEMEA